MSPFISTASDVSAYVVQIDDYSRTKSVKDGSAAQGENRQEVLNRGNFRRMFSLRMGWRSCCSYFSAITKGSAGFNPIATIKSRRS